MYKYALEPSSDSQKAWYSASDSFPKKDMKPHQRLYHRALGWTLKKALQSAYKWLSDNYKEGDRIFLFGTSISSAQVPSGQSDLTRYTGFSRGAMQARILSDMIHKIGLADRTKPRYQETLQS
ncbi:hypothetical protein MD484_g8142, partial [Candolleomyces efflorescens]